MLFFIYRSFCVIIVCRASFHLFGPSKRYRYGVQGPKSNKRPSLKSCNRKRTKNKIKTFYLYKHIFFVLHIFGRHPISSARLLQYNK